MRLKSSVPTRKERSSLKSNVPIDPVLVPTAPTGQFDERGGGEEAEAGESAGDAIFVVGDTLFVEEGVDAVVGVLGGEGAAETHGG